MVKYGGSVTINLMLLSGILGIRSMEFPLIILLVNLSISIPKPEEGRPL